MTLIECIAFIRHNTGCGLHIAKRIAEDLERAGLPIDRHGPKKPEYIDTVEKQARAIKVMREALHGYEKMNGKSWYNGGKGQTDFLTLDLGEHARDALTQACEILGDPAVSGGEKGSL